MLDPELLRRLMERAGIRGAKDLARRLNVGERTARRILKGEVSDRPRAFDLDRLARVLGVDRGVLTGEQPLAEDYEEQQAPGANVRTTVTLSAQSYNALVLNELRYDVPLRTQLELAALLFHIVAQRSLRHRRETAEKLLATLASVKDLVKEKIPHCAPISFDDHALHAEVESACEEDVFGDIVKRSDPDFFFLEDIDPIGQEIDRLADEIPDVGSIWIQRRRVSYDINHSLAKEVSGDNDEICKAIINGWISLESLRALLTNKQFDKATDELNKRFEDWRSRNPPPSAERLRKIREMIDEIEKSAGVRKRPPAGPEEDE